MAWAPAGRSSLPNCSRDHHGLLSCRSQAEVVGQVPRDPYARHLIISSREKFPCCSNAVGADRMYLGRPTRQLGAPVGVRPHDVNVPCPVAWV